MESVESPLEVLSRAATMLQRCRAYPPSDSDGFESPSTASSGESEGDRTLSPDVAPPRAPVAKQLPSSKWRRERRVTRLPHYKPGEGGSKALRSQSFQERSVRPVVGRHATHSDGESPEDDDDSPPVDPRGAPPQYPGCEAPIDMRLKAPRPPPPYTAPRVSVITPPTVPAAQHTGSMSMCDPVIDEHFRRSLGDDYMSLFVKKPSPGAQKTTVDRAASPIAFPADAVAKENGRATQNGDAVQKQGGGKNQNGVADNEKAEKAKGKKETVICEDVEMEMDGASSSVDDHFAKALGDTWRKLQSSKQQEKDGGKATRRGVVI